MFRLLGLLAGITQAVAVVVAAWVFCNALATRQLEIALAAGWLVVFCWLGFALTVRALQRPELEPRA